MKCKPILFFVLVVLISSFSSLATPCLAGDYGYSNPTLPTLQPEVSTGTNIVIGANYSINVNRSDNWDDLDTPADINTGDLTNDDTYVEVSGDSMTGNLEIDDTGDETSIILHGGDTNLNASIIFQEVALDRWQLLFNGLSNNFYLWNDFLDTPNMDG